MATIKQQEAFKEVVRGSTLSGAMRKVGYSETTAQRTNKLTRTKGWKELIEKELPDGLLAKKHRALLNKREVIVTHSGKETKVELTEQPHSDVKGALDMAYKIKAKYPKEMIEGNAERPTPILNIFIKGDVEINGLQRNNGDQKDNGVQEEN